MTALCPGFFRTNIISDSVGMIADAQRRYIEAEMARSKHDADAVARLALAAVERGSSMPCRTPRSAGSGAPSASRPGSSRVSSACLDRRGYFARA